MVVLCANNFKAIIVDKLDFCFDKYFIDSLFEQLSGSLMHRVSRRKKTA